MSKRGLSYEEERKIAAELAQWFLAKMVPAQHERDLTVRINKQGRPVRKAVSQVDETAIDRP